MIILGASGHGKVILECCLSSGLQVVAFADKDPRKLGTFMDLPVVSEDTLSNTTIVIGVGHNATRKRIATELLGRQNLKTSAPIIHSSGLVSHGVRVGPGTVVVHRAIVQTGTIVGQHCIVNTLASVDHDCSIQDFVHIAPGATLCGGVVVGEGSLIGAGSTIIPEVTIGKWATIGAGAVVIGDIPDYALAVGNPAKVVKLNQE